MQRNYFLFFGALMPPVESIVGKDKQLGAVLKD